MNEPVKIKSPSWFVRRDLDGFFGLALDNFIEKNFGKAGLWALGTAVLSWVGLLHSY
jgi:hypothetical protein